MQDIKRKSRFPYQVLLVDFLIYIFTILIVAFILTKTLFYPNSSVSPNLAMAIYLPTFVFVAAGFIYAIVIDKKHNNLEFRKLFVILGAIIALTNIIAIIALPNEINLPNVPFPYTISASERLYGVIYGLVIAFLPFLFFYLIPRRMNNNRYIKIIFIIIFFAIVALVLISFIKDFECYYLTIKSKFSDTTHPVTSIFNHKNIFALFLIVGIFTCIWLHVITKKWQWLLAIILFFAVELFTLSKMPIFASVILVLAYLIYRLVLVAKKSKNNCIIVVLVSSLVIALITLLSFFMVQAQSGILLTIRNALNSAIEGIKTTFSSRSIIWEDTLKILQPFQYVFGFGFALVGNAIQITYTYDPRLPEDPSGIHHAHNAGLETIAEGGVIYLLVNLFLYGYLIYIAFKARKNNPHLPAISIIAVVTMLILGLSDPIYLLGENGSIALALTIIIPIMQSYYVSVDKKEIANQQEIVLNAEAIKGEEYKNKLLRLNKKLLITDAKDIKKDYLIK